MNYYQIAKSMRKLVRGSKDQIPYVVNNFWRKMKKSPDRLYCDAVALYYYMKDPDVHWARKTFVVGALVYLISPVDAIPDVIPFVGYLDDAAVIAFTVRWLGSELEDYYTC